MFEFWKGARSPGRWIRGCLPSIYLGELILRDNYQVQNDWNRVIGHVVTPGRAPWDPTLNVWPYDVGIRGVNGPPSLVWAAGPEGSEEDSWHNQMLYEYFPLGTPTPAGDSWYLHGKGHFFWVFRQVPGQDLQILKVCGDINVDGQFDIACVQRARQNVTLSRVVHTTALDAQATSLPLAMVYFDQQFMERMCFFHCALVPEKLQRDFQDIMGEARGAHGWIPPQNMSPWLYSERGDFIPNPQHRTRKREATEWRLDE